MSWAGYAAATVIDGCGGPGDPASRDRTAPLTPQAVADALASGVTAVNLTLAAVGDSFADTLRYADAADGWIAAHPAALARVTSAAGLAACKASGRLGLVYGLQDLAMVGDDPRAGSLEALHGRGVRIVQPTYNRRNQFGDGCLEPVDGGLTPRGREALERLHHLRIVLDLSHCGPRTSAEAVAAAPRPVAFTHAGCAAVHAHPRNKGDELLRACAERGGVVGIYFMPYLRARGQPMAADVVRHIEHALQVCGEDGVGVGTDGSLSAVERTPALVETHRREVQERRAAGISAPGEQEDVLLFVPDLNGPRRLETLAGMLESRGHPGARVEKILGGNFARLLGAVWGS